MSQFRVEETISESSTTRVLRAFQVALSRRVLLKVLRPHLAADPVVKGRFVREAHACAQLRSEHIVQVYDLTEFENSPAIVMEYVNGQSLKQLLLHAPADRPALAGKTAVHVLRALIIAHRKGVTHRDIKPGNILVTEDEVMKVTDFGLAHLADSTVATADGIVVGTPAYMAPEQIRGEQIDTRTDLFSLGATLVEVLTGERIFEGETHTECIRKVLAFKPEDLDQYGSRTSGEFLDFLKRMMQPVPAMRYASAQEALAALNDKEESQPHGSLKTRLRGRKALASVLAGLLVISSIAALIVSRSGGEKNQYQQERTSAMPDTAALITVGGSDSARQTLAKRKADPKPESPNLRKGSQDGSALLTATPADSSRVRFTCNPWGQIYVDGRSIGETPIAESFSLTPGKHTIKFSNPLFEPIIKVVNLQPGRELTVSVDFMEGAGFLLCDANSSTEVYIDDVYRAMTPLSAPIVLSAGRHRVRLHHSSAPDVTREITVAIRDTVHLKMSAHE